MAQSIGPAGRAGSSMGGAAAGTSRSIAVRSIAVSPLVHGNSGLTCAITNRARPIAACRCSMPSPAPPRFVRAADLHQHDVDRQAATGYEAANIGNIGRYDVVGAAGEKPSPGAGA